VSGGRWGYLIAKLIWYECKPNIPPCTLSILQAFVATVLSVVDRRKSSPHGLFTRHQSEELAYFSTSKSGCTLHIIWRGRRAIFLQSVPILSVCGNRHRREAIHTYMRTMLYTTLIIEPVNLFPGRRRTKKKHYTGARWREGRGRGK